MGLSSILNNKKKKLDATKPEFKVLISCIIVANTTPNQQTSVRLAMPLLMCIQHVKVWLLYTNREILVTLKNCPANYCLAHFVFPFHCKCVSSFYTEGLNIDQVGGLTYAMVTNGRLRRVSPVSGVHDREGHCRRGTLLHGEWARLGPKKALMSGQRRMAVEEVRSTRGPMSVGARAAMRHGRVRLGCFLTGAPCSSVALRWWCR
jgi:hypothetical protein